jgi:HpcH/HpaI aldolase/citrate lyase family
VTRPDRLDSMLAEADQVLAAADRALAEGYPGSRAGRQPVHTVYLPAERFGPGLAAQWGRQALTSLETWAPEPAEFGRVMGLPGGLAADVRSRVLAKLAAEPIEDLRLDFEDGYHGADEDADARSAAACLAAEATGASGLANPVLTDPVLTDPVPTDPVLTDPVPPFTGLRCKSLERPTRQRAIRTLDLFLAELLARGPLPSGFVVTLPKVTSADQVTAMARLCARLEEAHGLPPGALLFEVQVETPQVILGADGTAVIARCVHAAEGRLTGLHYGTYDYSAALGIAAQQQSMDHPVADYARAVMQVAAAGTGVRLSDGSSNVLPEGGRDEVTGAWGLHARLVRRSLERGFYQGWDLHPAQLASRYAATFGFFREGLPAAAARLRSYVERTPGRVLEEPATARALAGYLGRGLDCGAITEPEFAALTGLDRAGLDELAVLT